MFTEEGLDWFNTGIFCWCMVFWLELPPSLVPFLEQFIYQDNQCYQETQLLTDMYSSLSLNFNARNKIIYCRIGGISKWKATCGWAVQLSRNCFRVLPVLVDLLWFEMLLVSVVSLYYHGIWVGVCPLMWPGSLESMNCHCWVYSALCIQSGEYNLVYKTGVESFFFFSRERACDGKELARFLACVLPPFPL